MYFSYPCQIYELEHVEIGNNVFINRGAMIRGGGGLILRDNVYIARNVTIYTYNHNYAGDLLPFDHTAVAKPVIIDKNAWIGVNVTIIPGITIGEGAIVGAGTVVSRSVPPLAIVGSQPPRIVEYRDRDHYDRLDEAGRYRRVDSKPGASP